MAEDPGAEPSPVRRVLADEAPDAVAVLAAAFTGYPALRFVLGGDGGDPARLRRLLGFFVQARLLRGEPILCIGAPGSLAAVALISHPGRVVSPPALDAAREELWSDLGAGARARYETFGRVAGAFTVPEPRVHLNMLAVLPSAQGSGLGRRILDAVHAHSAGMPWSEGVSLTTEDPANVPLYEHVGYEVVGRASIDGALTTWGMFRRDG